MWLLCENVLEEVCDNLMLCLGRGGQDDDTGFQSDCVICLDKNIVSYRMWDVYTTCIGYEIAPSSNKWLQGRKKDQVLSIVHLPRLRKRKILCYAQQLWGYACTSLSGLVVSMFAFQLSMLYSARGVNQGVVCTRFHYLPLTQTQNDSTWWCCSGLCSAFSH